MQIFHCLNLLLNKFSLLSDSQLSFCFHFALGQNILYLCFKKLYLQPFVFNLNFVIFKFLSSFFDVRLNNIEFFDIVLNFFAEISNLFYSSLIQLFFFFASFHLFIILKSFDLFIKNFHFCLVISFFDFIFINYFLNFCSNGLVKFVFFLPTFFGSTDISTQLIHLFLKLCCQIRSFLLLIIQHLLMLKIKIKVLFHELITDHVKHIFLLYTSFNRCFTT